MKKQRLQELAGINEQKFDTPNGGDEKSINAIDTEMNKAHGRAMQMMRALRKKLEKQYGKPSFNDWMEAMEQSGESSDIGREIYYG